MRKKWFFIAPLAMLAMIAFLFLFGLVVQQLWNWLLPPLFGWHAITYWQALALLVLCRILFGRVGPRGWHRPHWRERMQERCRNMTPEERERWKQRMRERWGLEPPASEIKQP
jgi:hypothetical protein